MNPGGKMIRDMGNMGNSVNHETISRGQNDKGGGGGAK